MVNLHCLYCHLLFIGTILLSKWNFLKLNIFWNITPCSLVELYFKLVPVCTAQVTVTFASVNAWNLGKNLVNIFNVPKQQLN